MTEIPESTRESPSLSVVVPVRDEEDSLQRLFESLRRVLDDLDELAEVILVDDGSRDRSYATMVELHAQDSRFKAVRLSRNFGHQMAITAGLDLTNGDAVIIMDADLQHPPEAIADLLAKWREGFNVVYGVRHERFGEPWLKRVTARVFYRLLATFGDTDMPPHAGDFRLVDRAALDAFRSLRESNRYVRGMFSWIGFRQVGVPYRGVERHAGTTKYSFSTIFKLGVDGMLSFSTVPLRVVPPHRNARVPDRAWALRLRADLKGDGRGRFPWLGVVARSDRIPGRDPATHARHGRPLRRPHLRRGQGAAPLPSPRDLRDRSV
jgi:glycosyltransferase involved in cell wall biosynthesis